MRPSATRVIVRAVGIDTQVATVGYSYANGNLDYDVPRQAAGHYVGTAEPGDRGNLVIGGHVSLRTGPAVFPAVAAPVPKVAASRATTAHSAAGTSRRAEGRI